MSINTKTSDGGINVHIAGTFGQWEENSDENIQAEYGKAYLLTRAGQQTITLPAPVSGSSNKGFAVKTFGHSDFVIAQNAGQRIKNYDWATTTGVTGGLTSVGYNAAIVLNTAQDDGLILTPTFVSGFFRLTDGVQIISNDGISPDQVGDFRMGNPGEGYPTIGSITSPDSSININKTGFEIQLTSAGGGSKSYGGVYKNVTNDLQGFNSSYSAFTTGTFNPSLLSDFTVVSTNALRYTGSTTKLFFVSLDIRANIGDETFFGSVNLNSTPIAEALFQLANTNVFGEFEVRMFSSVNFYLSLNTNDEIQPVFRCTSGTTLMSLTSLSFKAFEI